MLTYQRKEVYILITSTILKDSSFNGERILTYLLEVPKYLVYDITRHRVCSFSIASSRAMPVKTVLNNMQFEPTFWGKNCPGMQAHAELEEEIIPQVKHIWGEIKSFLTNKVQALSELGLHKQQANRACEFASKVSIVVTATDWISFFVLRAEYAADPHLAYLATLMLEQYLNNKPEELSEGDWHIPFIKPEECNMPMKNKLIKSMARCARTSYNNFYGKDDFGSHLKLHDMLINDKHYSPGEHQAQAINNGVKNSNFSKSWLQYRKTFEVEEQIDLQQRLLDMKELCVKRGFSF